MSQPIYSERHMRVICIGAGIAGLCFAYKLQRSFNNFSLTVYEKNEGVGGVWFENKYPGCAADFPSHNYTYSFEPRADWPEVYATGPQIKEHFEAFATKYDLQQYCKTSHEVIRAVWEEDCWRVSVKDTIGGEEMEDTCDILINACGILNAWKWPNIAGLQDFEGRLVHSAKWQDDIDVRGKRVGLIGNGSSGQQILTAIQPEVENLITFIRQPNWILGSFGEASRQYTSDEIENFKANPETLLRKRKRFESINNSYFPVCNKDSTAQAQIRSFLLSEMKKKIPDENLHDILIPKYSVGCRRPTPGLQYLESLSTANTQVVYGQIQRVTKKGVVDNNSIEHQLDILICATGFDTSYIPRFPLYGLNGVNLQDEWTVKVKAYMATAIADFPNYFMFCGPNNPIASGAYLSTVESQADYMLKFCDRWQTENIISIAPKQEAVDDFVKYAAKILKQTVWADHCHSWYKNPRNPSEILLWPGSGLHFIEALSDIRADDFNIVYKGNRFLWLGNGISQIEADPGLDKAFYIREYDDSVLLSRNHRRKALAGMKEGGVQAGLEAFGVLN